MIDLDLELDRLWDRALELLVRRDITSRRELTFAVNAARGKSSRLGIQEKEALRLRLKKSIASLEEEVNVPMLYGPSLNPASIVDATKDARAAFNGRSTPIGNIFRLVNSAKTNWSKDHRNWTKAYICACLSEIAYLHIGKYEVKGKDRYKIIPSEALRLLLETSLTIDLPRVLDNDIDIKATITDTKNFIFVSFIFHKFTIVAIRGTAPTLQDIAIDLKEMMLRKGREGYHMGFYNEAQRALLPLREAVPEMEHPIYFTGHSLGGALSGLLAKMWVGPEKRMTPYTFGCPRFGNQHTAQLHPIYSFVRKFDPVPYMPPSVGGYRPAGWPPTLVPPVDKLPRGRSFLRLTVSAHRIGGYRSLIGMQVKTPRFDPEIYFELLRERLLAK